MKWVGKHAIQVCHVVHFAFSKYCRDEKKGVATFGDSHLAVITCSSGFKGQNFRVNYMTIFYALIPGLYMGRGCNSGEHPWISSKFLAWRNAVIQH